MDFLSTIELSMYFAWMYMDMEVSLVHEFNNAIFSVNLLFNPPIFSSFIPFLTFSVLLFLFVIMYLFFLGSLSLSLSLSLSCVELARAHHHGWIFLLLPVLWQKLNMPVDVWQ